MARRFVQVLKDQLGENEVRAMAASKVAGPGLQVWCYFIFFVKFGFDGVIGSFGGRG